jgi:hypothetical protein
MSVLVGWRIGQKVRREVEAIDEKPCSPAAHWPESKMACAPVQESAAPVNVPDRDACRGVAGVSNVS